MSGKIENWQKLNAKVDICPKIFTQIIHHWWEYNILIFSYNLKNVVGWWENEPLGHQRSNGFKFPGKREWEIIYLIWCLILESHTALLFGALKFLIQFIPQIPTNWLEPILGNKNFFGEIWALIGWPTKVWNLQKMSSAAICVW